jgi:hypothetical protein
MTGAEVTETARLRIMAANRVERHREERSDVAIQ